MIIFKITPEDIKSSIDKQKEFLAKDINIFKQARTAN